MRIPGRCVSHRLCCGGTLSCCRKRAKLAKCIDACQRGGGLWRIMRRKAGGLLSLSGSGGFEHNFYTLDERKDEMEVWILREWPDCVMPAWSRAWEKTIRYTSPSTRKSSDKIQVRDARVSATLKARANIKQLGFGNRSLRYYNLSATKEEHGPITVQRRRNRCCARVGAFASPACAPASPANQMRFCRDGVATLKRVGREMAQTISWGAPPAHIPLFLERASENIQPIKHPCSPRLVSKCRNRFLAATTCTKVGMGRCSPTPYWATLGRAPVGFLLQWPRGLELLG